jgi:hypothetical protein
MGPSVTRRGFLKLAGVTGFGVFAEILDLKLFC